MTTSGAETTPSSGRILLVEDEAALADGVARGLRAEGFEAERTISMQSCSTSCFLASMATASAGL